MDDKSTRAAAQWQHLCTEFFNNESWVPENPFDDTRLRDINPSKPPNEPYQPEQLRKLFSKMRSCYSLFNDNYHASGQLEEGDGDGDDDFFDNFARGDTAFLYAHKLFKGCAPKFCTRDVNQKSDVGVGDNGTMVSYLTNGSQSGSKRKIVDLTKDDYKEIFAPSDAEKIRDESIASYFSLTKIENTINSESFKLLPPAMQEALMKKWGYMLAESYLD